ncbi:ead/Ea22-like family protein [Pseudomonas chlororaphis]|uniref:ead/Ea22-like family protein n=1 Tax=Pseudomonas chlororaphis TaxID=587753 RepID=UPI001B33E1D3|nr:ead/Ea22-like family protein [Pseudomonas chlororaphis]MBP5060224.1 hypothetical protein [Pseudomonas chlororaphis]MBP5143769.1 hypothetical protein [Pseudomonas chlororaphis]
MTDYTELKRLAEVAGGVEWKWWDSNSTLRLTTEKDGRHGADGDAISAYRDSVQCPEGIRAFIEAASPAAVLALISEIERRDENPNFRAIQAARAEVCRIKAKNEALRKAMHELASHPKLTESQADILRAAMSKEERP